MARLSEIIPTPMTLAALFTRTEKCASTCLESWKKAEKSDEDQTHEHAPGAHRGKASPKNPTLCQAVPILPHVSSVPSPCGPRRWSTPTDMGVSSLQTTHLGRASKESSMMEATRRCKRFLQATITSSANAQHQTHTGLHRTRDPAGGDRTSS